MFFYAGHGLQVAGQNFLVPIDAQLTTAFQALSSTPPPRNNPLARNLARAMGMRSTEIGRGLAAIEAGAGTLISFSTQPGNVALDGTGRNSPFAGALANYVSTSNDDLGAILIAVRNDVMKETGAQTGALGAFGTDGARLLHAAEAGGAATRAAGWTIFRCIP